MSDDHRSRLAALLELQRRQLEAVDADARERLQALAGAFEVMLGALDGAGATGDEAVRRSIAVAVTTLQFADSQAQRLDHAVRALDQMANLVRSPAFEQAAAWDALRIGMRAGCTMAREVEVFDGVFGTTASDSADGVELF